MRDVLQCLESASTYLRLAEEEFEKQAPRSLTDQQIDLRRAIQGARQKAQSASLILAEILTEAEAKERTVAE